MQNFVRQTSFNDDDKYRNTRVGKKDVKETNFCKDDKYTDTNNPPKTSRSSVGHTSVEQQKGLRTRRAISVTKECCQAEGINKDVKTTELNHPGGIKSTEHASKEQHKGVHKHDNSYELDRDAKSDPSKVTISGSRQKETLIALSNQQKGIFKQEDTSTKDKFGY
ncbi:hypothetical protein Pint_26984 [Pistacia integerrima]|uniref:Uncharacterized protein n=1 Tax=Pistacia integerrima TaxID=434235 RepID=A0ACC0YUN4_9ROSI|nr:hypothetical protein Pint_26984 [Pistacia integerrima]